MMMRTHIQCAELSTRALVQFSSFDGSKEGLKIAVPVMLLKGINMFNRVYSQRRSDVSYGGNKYSSQNTTSE